MRQRLVMINIFLFELDTVISLDARIARRIGNCTTGVWATDVFCLTSSPVGASFLFLAFFPLSSPPVRSAAEDLQHRRHVVQSYGPRRQRRHRIYPGEIRHVGGLWKLRSFPNRGARALDMRKEAHPQSRIKLCFSKAQLCCRSSRPHNMIRHEILFSQSKYRYLLGLSVCIIMRHVPQGGDEIYAESGDRVPPPLIHFYVPYRRREPMALHAMK